MINTFQDFESCSGIAEGGHILERYYSAYLQTCKPEVIQILKKCLPFYKRHNGSVITTFSPMEQYSLYCLAKYGLNENCHAQQLQANPFKSQAVAYVRIKTERPLGDGIQCRPLPVGPHLFKQPKQLHLWIYHFKVNPKGRGYE